MIEEMQKKNRVTPVVKSNSDKENKFNWKLLSPEEKKKCQQKFQSCKPNGSTIISKHELQRMLKQIGKETTEEEILQMIHEADPKGDGFMTYEAFQTMIENQKIKLYNEKTSFVGLTFDSILEEEKKKVNSVNAETITWEFLKFYLMENFGLNINPKSLANPQNGGKPISRDDFMSIFS